MIDKLTNKAIQKSFKKTKVDIDFQIVDCQSTQSYAKGISVAVDTVIITKEQKKGIGRLGRKFISVEGGCYFTLIKKGISKNILATIPIVSVAIATVLGGYGIKADIKWPNDILVNGKKICGILCSTSGENTCIGIGINVFNDIEEIQDIATSLYSEGVLTKTRADVIAEILYEFYQLSQTDFSIVQEKYKKRLNIIGQSIKVVQADKEIEGTVEGISEEGFLIVNSGNEKTKVVYGDITIN